jgi:3-oxoacyl-[acyl-carrier protein] reductase
MAPMSLAGRVALVTGGSRGIGRAIALALAEDGADVAVNYARDEAAAKQTVAEIEALGRRARAYRASVDDLDADRAMVEAASAELGAIDILINNAGIASRGQTVEKTDPAELERVVRVHALGPAFLCRLVLPAMKTKGRGDIVMISSVATLGYGARGAPYNMGKAAMEALAYTLANELRPHHIHVNIVAPGLVETEMGRRLVKARQGVTDLRQLDATMPFGRVCQPEDIANVVRFVVSEGAGYVTGQKINVHGGGQ